MLCNRGQVQAQASPCQEKKSKMLVQGAKQGNKAQAGLPPRNAVRRVLGLVTVDRDLAHLSSMSIFEDVCRVVVDVDARHRAGLVQQSLRRNLHGGRYDTHLAKVPDFFLAQCVVATIQ